MAIPKQALLIGIGATTVAGGGVGVYLLSQDKTIEHRLIREGEKMISDKDEYEVAYMERKDDENFKKETGLVTDSKADAGGKLLDTWCKKNKELKLSKENIENELPKVKKYCTKPSSNIEEKYKKLGKNLIEKSKWKDKLDAIKSQQVEVLKQDLGVTTLDETGSKNPAIQALEDWCNKQKEIKLINDKDNAIWEKVKGRCLQT